MPEPLQDNYEVAKLLTTSYVAAMTPNRIKEILPPTIDITNRKAVQRFLRSEVIKELLSTAHKQWFKDLTIQQVSRLLDVPKHYVTKEDYAYISQQEL